jgi:nucleoid-associated protein YgaU
MGMVQQAVLDFDQEVQAPWRPRLVAVPGDAGSAGPRGLRPHPSGRSSSRVGICRPVESAAASGPPVRRRPAPVGGRPAPSDVRVAVPGVASVGPQRRRPTATTAGFRLTRRARRLAVVLTLAVGVAIGSWLGPLIAGGDGDLRLAGVQSVVVQPGDTLWSIAADAAGAGDVRAAVDRIQELNGLQGTVLIPGQVIELP